MDLFGKAHASVVFESIDIPDVIESLRKYEELANKDCVNELRSGKRISDAHQFEFAAYSRTLTEIREALQLALRKFEQ